MTNEYEAGRTREEARGCIDLALGHLEAIESAYAHGRALTVEEQARALTDAMTVREALHTGTMRRGASIAAASLGEYAGGICDRIRLASADTQRQQDAAREILELARDMRKALEGIQIVL